MDEEEHFVEYTHEYPVYPLFSGQSSGLNRRSGDELLSGFVYRRMGSLGVWYGAGNGADNHILSPG